MNEKSLIKKTQRNARYPIKIMITSIGNLYEDVEHFMETINL